ncbi:hypothetical protein D3C71_1732670 [compost metagenome]
MNHSIGQRAGIMAMGGMHDHAGRLVDNKQMVILIQDVERNRLRQNILRDLRLHPDFHQVSGPDMHADVDPFSVQSNTPFGKLKTG